MYWFHFFLYFLNWPITSVWCNLLYHVILISWPLLPEELVNISSNALQKVFLGEKYKGPSFTRRNPMLHWPVGNFEYRLATFGGEYPYSGITMQDAGSTLSLERIATLTYSVKMLKRRIARFRWNLFSLPWVTWPWTWAPGKIPEWMLQFFRYWVYIPYEYLYLSEQLKFSYRGNLAS